MITDNSLNDIRIAWNEIATHRYERISRAKWRAFLTYACGASTNLDNLPDDLIQCLVLGAYNSGRTVQTNLGESAGMGASGAADWRDLQAILLAADAD